MIDKKVVLDTNVLIDNPEAALGYTEVILPYTVLHELDGHKRNPDLKRAAQAAIKCINIAVKRGNLTVVDLPKQLTTPDELIVKAAKDSNAEFITQDIGARVIAKANGVTIGNEDLDDGIDSEYKGYIEVSAVDDINYETHWKHLKEVMPAEVQEKFNQTLAKNQYLIVYRSGGAEDIWKEFDGKVLRISQSSKPLKSAGVVDVPLDSVQQCALDAIMDPDVALTVIDGKIGTGKTILTLMGALATTIGQKNFKYYRSIMVTRPPISTDKRLEIGFLPGPQPLSSKVLTPTGWVTMGSLSVGDYVIGRDGKKTRILNIFPKGKKEVFSIKTNTGKETTACADHLWLTQNHNEFKHNKPGQLRSTKEIADSIYYQNTNKLSHHLPRREPCEFNVKELPIDPYLLGVLLGDGSVTKHSLNISSIDMDIIKYFHNKSIPKDYIYASSIEDRLELLRGLLDTGGTVNRGNALFHTSSNYLQNDVIELVQSLGGSTYIYTRDRVEEQGSLLNGKVIKATKECHEVGIRLPIGMNPFKLLRKASKYRDGVSKSGRNKYVTTDIISSIEFKCTEEVQCLLLDSKEHLYITDDFIVTHNTLEDKLGDWVGGVKSNLKFLFEKDLEKATREEASRIFEEFFEMINIASIQGVSLHNVILIVDEYQLLDTNGLKLVLSRIAQGAKLVLVGDTFGQTYGINRGNEGYKTLYKHLGKSEVMSYIKLENIYRSKLSEFVEEVFN